MVINTHIGGKWTWQGDKGPICHDSRCHIGTAQCPTCPFHITDLWERSSKPSPALILSRFAPMVTMDWSQIHGSTVIDLEPSNQPLNHLTNQIFTRAAFTTTFGSQPRPYNRKVVESYTGRCPYHVAQHPCLLHQLPTLPISTPTTSRHYKRGSGARWSSAPSHFITPNESSSQAKLCKSTTQKQKIGRVMRSLGRSQGCRHPLHLCFDG